MIKLMVIPIILLSLCMAIPIEGASQQPTQLPTLVMSKLSTQATSLGNNCYFPILIQINATWTQPASLYTVSLRNFWLVLTTRNLVIGNATNAVYKNPDNTIQDVTLFPNLPVTLALSFTKTCVSNVNIVQLMYLDGTYNNTWTLP